MSPEEITLFGAREVRLARVEVERRIRARQLGEAFSLEPQPVAALDTDRAARPVSRHA